LKTDLPRSSTSLWHCRYAQPQSQPIK